MTLTEYNNQKEAQRLPAGTVELQEGEYTFGVLNEMYCWVIVNGLPYRYAVENGFTLLYSMDGDGNKKMPTVFKLDRVLKEKEMRPNPYVNEIPSKQAIVGILQRHPVFKLTHKVKEAYLVGSVERGEQRLDSDIDICLICKDNSGLTELYRNKLRLYFMKNNIVGKNDDAHPMYNNRRIDVYFEVPKKSFIKLV